MDEIKALVGILRIYLPELEVLEVGQPSPAGQYNHVLIVNRALIFRFPRYAAGLEALRREALILQALHGRLPLPIPEPIHLNLEAEEPGSAFMGYPLLPGSPLWRETLQAIHENSRLEAYAGQLAGFLEALHNFPTGLAGIDSQLPDVRAEAAALYAQVCEKLLARMRPDAQESIRAHFEAFMDTSDLHDFEARLIHGDFGGSNILHDPAAGCITGVIDFGFSGPGDPARDLAAVSTYGQNFFNLILNHYPHDPSMLQRAAYYRGTFALEEALYGLAHGDLSAYEAGMAEYV